MGKSNSAVGWGFLAGALIMLAADAVHWFITPHPEASTVRTALVAAQLIASIALAVWAWKKGRALERGDRQGMAARGL